MAYSPLVVLVGTNKRARESHSTTPGLKKTKSSGLQTDLLPKPTRPTTPGRVYVFGTGDCAQLGLGEDILSRKKPANLAALNDEQIVDIAAGGMHTMALTAEGKVTFSPTITLCFLTLCMLPVKPVKGLADNKSTT